MGHPQRLSSTKRHDAMLADIRKLPDYREPIVNPMAAIIESYRSAMLRNQTPDRFLNLS